MFGPRRHFILACAVVVVFGLLEVGARFLSPYLPEPDLWPDKSTQVKVDQMDDLACSDVVFAGNSMARDAFDPVQFDQIVNNQTGAEIQTYNAALDAAAPEHLGRWLPEEVVPRLEPSLVVVAVSSADLNENANLAQAAYEGYGKSIKGRNDLLGRIQAQLVDVSALIRYRDTLRHPDQVWDALGMAISGDNRSESTDEVSGVIGEHGEGLSRRNLTYEGSAAIQTLVENEMLNDFEIGETQIESTRQLIDEIRAGGADVVLVLLPVTEDYIDLHPNGAADWEAFRDELANAAATKDVELIDLHLGFATSDGFADTHHVNAAGTEELTTSLATSLATTFAAQISGQPIEESCTNR